MFGWMKEWAIRREAQKQEKRAMGNIWRKAVGWFTAKPGRKRGIAAVLLGAGTVLRVLGHTDLADSLSVANDIAQQVLVPGMELSGGVMAIIGLLHAAKKDEL